MNKMNFSLKNRLLKSSIELFLVALIGFLLPFWIAKIEQANSGGAFLLASVNAQTLAPELVAAKVYEQFPELPKQNKYILKETGEIDTSSTLISRLVRYHQYVKARPTIFRLDWKLTLSDYLGANERIDQQRYPGSNTLNENPLQDDIKAVDSLTLTQRQELVDILVTIYNPQSSNNSNPPSSEAIKPSPIQTTPKPTFELPQPGGAELLK